MTKKNNKKTPEPMFVGTEPEEMAKNIESPQNLDGDSVTSGQMEEMGSATWVHEESGPMPEVNLHQMEEVDSIPFKSPQIFTFMYTSDAAIRGSADSFYKKNGHIILNGGEPKPMYIIGVDGLEPKPETDDGTRPEPLLGSNELALKIIDAAGGKFPTQIIDSLIQPGQKEYKHPFDPINDLHYQLNNAIQPLVDSMQKIIRDPYKASEVMSTVQFNYMVKEYGYLHSFLELSHKLIKERLRERV